MVNKSLISLMVIMVQFLEYKMTPNISGIGGGWWNAWMWGTASVQAGSGPVSTKYRCHRPCHLQMSPASGLGAPRSASPTLQDRGGRFRRTPTGPRSTETHGDHSGVNDGSIWPHASRPLL